LSAPPSLDLDQPRTFGALLTETLGLYFRNFLRFVAVGLAVVVPAEAIVSGVGLGMFGSGYDAHRPLAADLMPQVVQVLVTTPLIAAITLFALLDLADEQRPRVRTTIQRGLDSFAAVFVPVLAAVGAEALVTLLFVVPLALAVGSAFVPTLIIPFVLAVRWYFVPQAVVHGGERRLAALRASWDLTRGSAWRVFGIVALAYIALLWAAGLVSLPLIVAARSADSGALVVAADVVAQSLAAPAIAILSALLYFDLRARARGAADV
jgi:hypothetical protein